MSSDEQTRNKILLEFAIIIFPSGISLLMFAAIYVLNSLGIEIPKVALFLLLATIIVIIIIIVIYLRRSKTTLGIILRLVGWLSVLGLFISVIIFIVIFFINQTPEITQLRVYPFNPTDNILRVQIDVRDDYFETDNAGNSIIRIDWKIDEVVVTPSNVKITESDDNIKGRIADFNATSLQKGDHKISASVQDYWRITDYEEKIFKK